MRVAGLSIPYCFRQHFPFFLSRPSFLLFFSLLLKGQNAGRRANCYITWQPPLKLFGQTGLGHWPSRMLSRATEVPLGQTTGG